ncbi:acyl-CoA N-acyltransferase [Lophiostoma macrostomum CBS 122681]|uniref:Acyl-CoA N-acyltransferase n=1 Tax=Lophiostoma macrostomum CBS 122681 TaxID=1314788 RepID=A0A6A6TUU4_9PLEO|nr:acyl-CoA N-acyltransferase [Lophiostoma macrostomum CBS 122681]
MDAVIETPRLRLTRLTNTDLGSLHLAWFHKHWSDPVSTAWSSHGQCKTLEESREWMKQRATGNHILYAIHVKSKGGEHADTPTEELGLVGNCGLRCVDTGPRLPPPAPPASLTGMASTADQRNAEPQPQPIRFRVLGYALFETAWGKGYATEACAALIDAYRSSSPSSSSTKEKEPVLNYLEANLHPDNVGSIRVLEKLGFQRVG